MQALTIFDVRSDASFQASGRWTPDEFAELVAEHQQAVCAVAYSTLGDRGQSEEIAQEAFLVAWRKLPGLSERPELPGWLCGIARNLARNARRRRRAEPVGDAVETVPSGAASPLDRLLDAEREDLVYRALEALPDTYREPLILYYRLERSVREVARALEIEEHTAKKRLSRGRAQLQTKVGEMVERTLEKSRVGPAFTAAVMAAVATAVATPAEAASATTSPAASASLGKSLGLAVALTAAIGLGATSLAGGWSQARGEPSLPSLVSGDERVVANEVAPIVADPGPDASGALPTRPSPSRFRPLATDARAEPTRPGADDHWAGPDTLSADLLARLERRIDLDLSQASVGEVLRLLGEVGQVDIVVRGDIDSDITLALKATTALEALDETLLQAGAVWREVGCVHVSATEGPPGEPLGGPPLTVDVKDVELATLTGTLSRALDMPIRIDGDVGVPRVTARFTGQPAGVILASVTRQAGLRYEVAPAIEVRPEEDLDREDEGDEDDDNAARR